MTLSVELAAYKAQYTCRSCGKGLQFVWSLGHQYPVCFPEGKADGVTMYPLDLCICEDPACGLVQLGGTVDPEVLFKQHYWYRSGINESMRDALRDVVLAALQRQARVMHSGDWVVDIGANDGTLLSVYASPAVADYNLSLHRCAVEPAPNVQERLKAHCEHRVQDFFPTPALKFLNGKAKVVTAIAMAYDLPDPNAFFVGVKEILALDGLFICQLGYLGDLLSHNAFDSICHEHVEYYSLTSLSKLLTRQGLVVEDVAWNSVNGGSIRCYIRHSSSGAAPSAAVLKMISEEESSGMHKVEPYRSLMQRVEGYKNQTLGLLREAGGEAWIYGASTKGLTLMQTFGIGADLIQGAAERDEEKWGRWYGKTGVQIVPEETWRMSPPRKTLVPIWHFRGGIVGREAEWLDRGGEFVFPLPTVQVVKGSKG